MPPKGKGRKVSQSEGHSHGHGGSCNHDHGHSHSHAGGHEHEHSHAHGGHDHDHSHAHGSHDHNEHDHGHSHGHGGHHDHDHGHSHSHGHGSCSHDHSMDNQPFVDPIIELTQRLATTKITTHQSIAESNATVGTTGANGEKIEYSSYVGEEQLDDIMALIEKDLSEPYSIFTYRYFISDWPQLCVLAKIEDKIIGVVVCKLDTRQRGATRLRGYIAMLAVDQNHRKLGIGSRLVREAIYKMMLENADEVVLETELSNKGALALYETLGFIRDKRLHKYYLNGGDAFRLVLPLTPQFLATAP